jgi:hypothetical protein
LKLPQDIVFLGLQLWKPLQLHQQHLQQENQLSRVQEEMYDQMSEQQQQKPYGQVREHLQRMHQHMQ